MIDFESGWLDGLDLSSYFEIFFSDIPFFHKSGFPRERDFNRSWPDCIERFTEKSIGFNDVLHAMAKIKSLSVTGWRRDILSLRNTITMPETRNFSMLSTFLKVC